MDSDADRTAEVATLSQWKTGSDGVYFILFYFQIKNNVVNTYI